VRARPLWHGVEHVAAHVVVIFNRLLAPNLHEFGHDHFVRSHHLTTSVVFVWCSEDFADYNQRYGALKWDLSHSPNPRQISGLVV
jgi:hypothetical protein